MRRRKVLLVNANLSRTPYPVPPVGLCLVAESISSKYSVKIHDGVFGTGDGLLNLLREYNPDYVGIGIRNIDDYSADQNAKRNENNYFVPALYEQFVKLTRSVFKGPVILGGSGYSLFPYELLDAYGADYGIIGEGENVFPQLLHALDNGEKYPDIERCICRESPGPLSAAPAAHVLADVNANIDRWIDYGPYLSKGAYPLQTKRGCPHNCIYCSYSLIEGRKYRLRSVNDVVDEMESVLSRLDTDFEIVDSVFNDPPGHAEEICREIIRRGLHVRLRTMGMNPSAITDELVNLMRTAGFAQIDCTPDTASVDMIKNYRKNFTYSQLVNASEVFRRNEMPVMWFFILGGPGETIDTLNETFDFIEHNIDDFDLVYLFDGMRVYPGTGLHSLAVEDGLISEKESLLKPVYYLSRYITNDIMQEIISSRKKGHLNWISASESRPDAALMGETIAYRSKYSVNEPMFRSLLKVKWMKAGRKI